MSSIIRGAIIAAITLLIYGTLLAAVFFLFRLRQEVGATPMLLIMVGGMFGILAGHASQHLVAGNTFAATAKLTFHNAMHDKRTFPLVLRAVEWFGLSLAATGVASVVNRLQ